MARAPSQQPGTTARPQPAYPRADPVPDGRAVHAGVEATVDLERHDAYSSSGSLGGWYGSQLAPAIGCCHPACRRHQKIPLTSLSVGVWSRKAVSTWASIVGGA